MLSTVCVATSYINSQCHAKFLYRDKKTKELSTVTENQLLTPNRKIRPECLFDIIQNNRLTGPDMPIINKFLKDYHINPGEVIYSEVEPNEYVNLSQFLDDIIWPEAN